MSNTLYQFNEAGEFAWNESITGFTGLQATDKDGNIFVLLDVDGVGSVRKYDSNGSFIGLLSLTYTPSDISYGFDDYIYICGDDTTDGYVSRVDRELSSHQVISISNDPAVQICADITGNSYVVVNSAKIYKFSALLAEVWVSEHFTNVPKIVVTRNGDIYAAGLSESGGWISTNEPSMLSYWQLGGDSSKGAYDSDLEMFVELYDGYGLELLVRSDSDWYEGLKPSKMRVIFDDGFYIKTMYLNQKNAYPWIHIADTGFFPGTGTSTNPSNGFVSGDEIAIDPSWVANPSAYDLETFVIVGMSSSEAEDQGLPPSYEYLVRVSDIQFYAGVIQDGIVSISSDGSIIGTITRDTTIQQILLDTEGRIIVREDDSVISLINPSSGEDVWSYDTELEVSTLITDIYGEVSTNSLAGIIKFSSNVYIAGSANEAYVVRPRGEIVFSQPTPTIDGYQTIIHSDGGQINFQSNADLTINVDVVAGGLNFSSNSAVIVPVQPEAGNFQFSDSLTSADIIGDLTIIKPIGNINFGPYPGLWVLTSDSFNTGPIVLIDPPEMQFTSVPIGINSQTILISPGEIAFTGMVLGQDDTLAEFDLSLPKFDLDIRESAGISFSFPAFDLSAEVFNGSAGVLVFTLPELSLNMFSGAFIEETIPGLTLQINAATTTISNIISELTPITLVINSENNPDGNILGVFPAFQLEMDVLSGIISNLSCQFNNIELTINGTNENIVNFEGSIKELTFKMVSVVSGPSSILAEIPRMKGSIISGSLDYDILRYVRRRVR